MTLAIVLQAVGVALVAVAAALLVGVAGVLVVLGVAVFATGFDIERNS